MIHLKPYDLNNAICFKKWIRHRRHNFCIVVLFWLLELKQRLWETVAYGLYCVICRKNKLSSIIIAIYKHCAGSVYGVLIVNVFVEIKARIYKKFYFLKFFVVYIYIYILCDKLFNIYKQVLCYIYSRNSHFSWTTIVNVTLKETIWINFPGEVTLRFLLVGHNNKKETSFVVTLQVTKLSEYLRKLWYGSSGCYRQQLLGYLITLS